MSEDTRRSVNEGLRFGLLAGLILGLMEMVAAVVMGNPPLMPLRMFASVVLGQEALMGTSLGTAVVVGLIAHFAISALYGFIYGLVNARFTKGSDRASYGSQIFIGLLFGLGVWLVNFQIVARLAYPWFLGTPQLMQALMHAVFYGLPLAVMYAAGERRAHEHFYGHHA